MKKDNMTSAVLPNIEQGDAMNYIKPLMLITVFILVSISFTSEARIVCWTNKDGVKECGDRIPPEYSQKAHQELNEQGLVIDKTARAKTDEELAEEKKQEEAEAEKARQAEEQARQDKILLDTFSNVDDINMARDGKVAAIETTISLAEKRNEKLQEDLDKLVEQAAALERSGKTPSEDLVKDIDTARRQINNNNEFIASKRSEQDAVKDEYAQHVERFKELKAMK